MEKLLGKIESIKFGNVGYQDIQFGIQVTLSGVGWGVCDTISHSWSLDIEVTEYTKWTEEDRDKGYAKTMRKINELMKNAKVTDIQKLKGVPVECTFDNMQLKDWRILSEVL